MIIDSPIYIDKIMAFVDAPFVKILTGVRRLGKSTILKLIMERLKKERSLTDECILSYCFASMKYKDMSAKEVYNLLKEKVSKETKTYLFLDEVQEINAQRTAKCEYERLLEIADNYPKYVLTTDEFAGGNFKGVKTMHIADFLLSLEY